MDFGSIGLMSIGLPFLTIGTATAVVRHCEAVTGRSLGALPVGFGGFPALVLLSHMVDGVRTAVNPYCSGT